MERLKMMAEFLEQAEPVMAELDRGLRVFKPSGRMTHFNLPDAFYDRTSDEIQVNKTRLYKNVTRNLCSFTDLHTAGGIIEIVHRYAGTCSGRTFVSRPFNHFRSL